MATDIKPHALLTPGGHVRLSGTPEQAVNTLGVLANFVGTWAGSNGWNVIAVPDPQGGPDSFLLLVRPIIETITFTPVGALVPNRAHGVVQMVPALNYELRVFDRETNQPLHIENGEWLLLTDFVPPQNGQSETTPAPTLARLAAIPHGVSVLALGGYEVSQGPPQIPDLSVLPFPTTGAPLGYTDAYLNMGVGVPFKAPNINQPLQDFIAGQEANGQKIVETTTIIVTTNPPGGILDIPFVQQHANATYLGAAFWIERVEDEKTGDVFEQLQYSQETRLEFNPQFDDPSQLITWPHTNVNTLVKQ